MVQQITDRYIPSGSTKIADKLSDAIAYIRQRAEKQHVCLVYWGNGRRPIANYGFKTAEAMQKEIARLFNARREQIARKAQDKIDTKTKALKFAASVQVGDIFHYSFGYDETHHVFYEVVDVKGQMATVRKIAQAQKDLGYDYRHRCMPQSGTFISEPQRVRIQDGRIKVDRHYHASRWNTARVAGVPVGPAYEGGGAH
jgi:hypothetical protein